MEVARRICSPIDDENRSRISVMGQLFSEPRIMFKIPGTFHGGGGSKGYRNELIIV